VSLVPARITRPKAESPDRQLDAFINRYMPAIQKTARQALKKIRQRLPGAVEFVYDNYNALVIGFGPTDRPSEAVLSIALYPKWINLYFLNGATLSDPERQLKGSGAHVRRIMVDTPEVLDEPPVKALIAEAVKASDVPFKRTNSRRLLIKAIAARQRPRRPL
jgi:hypothetical protein